jgi:dTDP-glucose 4,6-dehydratase
MKLLVTGAAGFIGSSFIREALNNGHTICVLDLLTYAGHIENIEDLIEKNQIQFIQGDICDFENNLKILNDHKIEALVNFAAESHVDNSIHGPKDFIQTNIMGTFALLEASRSYWNKLEPTAKENFRYLQVSTDEVFGSLGNTGRFSELTSYHPNSPYSASKASADHLVRAWHHTYKLPTITTNCSNNYGPRQFPEKLIPLMIDHAINSKALPVYGTGTNIRDWIHVEDHAHGVLLALTKGKPGSTYCFGGNSERNNLHVVQTLCKMLDELKPRYDKKSYAEQISFVTDRAGHDWRYAIDDSLAQEELGFTRKYKNFEEGLQQTIKWYLENQTWITKVSSKPKVAK